MKIEIDHQNCWGYSVGDKEYYGEYIKVKRKCVMTDLQAIYVVTKGILEDGSEDGFYDQVFDEYHCFNCESYDIDWEDNHVRPE